MLKSIYGEKRIYFAEEQNDSLDLVNASIDVHVNKAYLGFQNLYMKDLLQSLLKFNIFKKSFNSFETITITVGFADVNIKATVLMLMLRHIVKSKFTAKERRCFSLQLLPLRHSVELWRARDKAKKRKKEPRDF